jgi:hypothetical protein
MAKPLVLYSTNSKLAYRINEAYYHGIHYVWCSQFFHHGAALQLDVNMVPSSTPASIFLEYRAGVLTGDSHNAKILGNRKGLLKGTKNKLENNIINQTTHDEIVEIIQKSTLTDFQPVVYVIPYTSKLAKLIGPLAISEKAHPFSPEILMPHLPRSHFDVIEWHEVKHV